jgi:dTDP-4-dehydrorhamnose reductase
MEKSDILLTGGSGLLGTELQKYLPMYAPSHAEMDITKEIVTGGYKPKIVVHCAAYTDVLKAETDRVNCFWLNVMGTKHIVDAFPDSKIIFISTEYAEEPVNYYGQTKQEAEIYVKLNAKDHLIIRTLFKANPYPYEFAFFDQYTDGDYVDVIAPLIVGMIAQKFSGFYHVGTGRKSMFELARRTRPEIKAISVDDIKGVKLPKEAHDYS